MSRLIWEVIWLRCASISTVNGTRNAAAITSVIGIRMVNNRMRIVKISMKPEARTNISYYALPAAERRETRDIVEQHKQINWHLYYGK